MLDLTVKFISVNSLIFGNNNMDIATALQIVIDLARQNVLDDKDVFEDELTQQMLDQKEAINMVEDMAVNLFGDDEASDSFAIEDHWFDHKTQKLVGDFRLSGTRWIIGSTNVANPSDDAVFIKHENAFEPSYMTATEANLLIAAIRCAQDELKEMAQ